MLSASWKCHVFGVRIIRKTNAVSSMQLSIMSTSNTNSSGAQLNMLYDENSMWDQRFGLLTFVAVRIVQKTIVVSMTHLSTISSSNKTNVRPEHNMCCNEGGKSYQRHGSLRLFCVQIVQKPNVMSITHLPNISSPNTNNISPQHNAFSIENGKWDHFLGLLNFSWLINLRENKGHLKNMLVRRTVFIRKYCQVVALYLLKWKRWMNLLTWFYKLCLLMSWSYGKLTFSETQIFRNLTQCAPDTASQYYKQDR